MPRATDPGQARAAAEAVVSRLRAGGHVAYLAGGCVRDELLGLHPTDYDVATDATPAAIRALFRHTSEVGEAFGVVLVHDGGRHAAIEVATFRADGPYSDARRPDSVSFSDEVADARRRDFTINALFLDPAVPAREGGAGAPGGGARVIDHVGGVADLRAGVIRAVGDPDARLREDHLRALRAVRFAARLGFEIEPATRGAIRRHARELRGVSRERIGDEVRRMLAHPSRARSAELMTGLGLDGPVLDEPPALGGAPDAAGSLEVGGLELDAVVLPVLRAVSRDGVGMAFPAALAAWAIDRPGLGGRPPRAGEGVALARRWRRALCLSNDERDELEGVLEGVAVLHGAWNQFGVPSRKRAAARATFGSALRVYKAVEPAAGAAIEGEAAALEADGVGIAPAPLVTGDDLVALGMRPGPVFKTLLDRVYDAQLEGLVRDRGSALELARRLGV